jgi:hypothetical protein
VSREWQDEFKEFKEEEPGARIQESGEPRALRKVMGDFRPCDVLSRFFTFHSGGEAASSEATAS